MVTSGKAHGSAVQHAKHATDGDAFERARLRRNQRNSRARKQAYIRDLETRWNECLRLGAQATQEMQQEARRVHEENRLLRAVLLQQGLDHAAIQSSLDAARAHLADQEAATSSPSGALAHAAAPLAELNACQAPCGQMFSTVPSGPSWMPRWAPDSSGSDSFVHLDPSQPAYLDNWLNDLCEIKDAFGAEAFADAGATHPRGFSSLTQSQATIATNWP